MRDLSNATQHTKQDSHLSLLFDQIIRSKGCEVVEAIVRAVNEVMHCSDYDRNDIARQSTVARSWMKDVRRRLSRYGRRQPPLLVVLDSQHNIAMVEL